MSRLDAAGVFTGSQGRMVRWGNRPCANDAIFRLVGIAGAVRIPTDDRTSFVDTFSPSPRCAGRLEMMAAGDVFGWLAGILTLLAFSMRSIKALRVSALGANVCFIAYGALNGLYPVVVLHALLLPCNLLRLWQLCFSGSSVANRSPPQDASPDPFMQVTRDNRSSRDQHLAGRSLDVFESIEPHSGSHAVGAGGLAHLIRPHNARASRRVLDVTEGKPR